MTARSITVCGLRVPVRVGTVEDCSALKGAYGCYDIDTGVIWLSTDAPPYAQKFWLAHEGLHAVLHLSGVLRVTASMLGLDLDKPRDRKLMDAWEEAFVRVLTPHVLETFGAAS